MMFLLSRKFSSFVLMASAASVFAISPAYAQLEEIKKEEILQPIGNTAPVAPVPEEVIELEPLEPLESVSAPEQQELASPQPEEEALPNIPEPEGELDGFNENVFFDAESLVPTTEMGRKGGPRKVNPRLEPGSKLVVATKNYRAGSKQAQLVAADRAIKLGRYESALAIYDQLYTQNSSDPNILLGRATTLQHLDQDDLALQAYEEFLDRYPRNTEAKINMLGLMGKRYPAVALRQLIDMYEEQPSNVGVVAQIAVMQAKLARFGEAIQYLGIAASMEPQNANHVYNMAVIADRAGSKSQAIQYYEEALEIDTLYGAGRTIPRDAVFERLAMLR